MRLAHEHLDYIDWLTDNRRWLAGAQLSLADFAAAAQISVADYLGGIDWAGHEEAHGWYRVMKSRPSFRPLLTEKMEGIPPPSALRGCERLACGFALSRARVAFVAFHFRDPQGRGLAPTSPSGRTYTGSVSQASIPNATGPRPNPSTASRKLPTVPSERPMPEGSFRLHAVFLASSCPFRSLQSAGIDRNGEYTLDRSAARAARVEARSREGIEMGVSDDHRHSAARQSRE